MLADHRTLFLLAAYASVPAMAVADAAIGGDGPESGIPLVVYFGVPALLAACVGWVSSWRSCVEHAIGMTATGILGYWLIGSVGFSSPHAEPVTFATIPWFSAGLLSVVVPGFGVGRFARIVRSNFAGRSRD